MSHFVDFSDPVLSKVQSGLHPVEVFDGTDEVKQAGQRRAAVLVPLVKRIQGWQVLLTQRPDTMPRHAGQISFPGGRLEAGESSLNAALRESHEEVGLAQDNVFVLGRLDSFDAISNFRVTPYVGVFNPQAKIVPEPREVADVFEIPLAHFMSPENHVARTFNRDGRDYQLWDMPYTAPDGTHRNVWGMTAMMLYRLYRRSYMGDMRRGELI